MQNSELPIIDQFLAFYKQFYGYRKLFPKQDRHMLGAKCESYIIEILAELYKAKFAGRVQRAEIIQTTSENFDLLKVFVRLLFEMRVLPQGKYLILERRLQEIGRMLGGWLKSQPKNQNGLL